MIMMYLVYPLSIKKLIPNKPIVLLKHLPSRKTKRDGEWALRKYVAKYYLKRKKKLPTKRSDYQLLLVSSFEMIITLL